MSNVIKAGRVVVVRPPGEVAVADRLRAYLLVVQPAQEGLPAGERFRHLGMHDADRTGRRVDLQRPGQGGERVS